MNHTQAPCDYCEQYTQVNEEGWCRNCDPHCKTCRQDTCTICPECTKPTCGFCECWTETCEDCKAVLTWAEHLAMWVHPIPSVCFYASIRPVKTPDGKIIA